MNEPKVLCSNMAHVRLEFLHLRLTNLYRKIGLWHGIDWFDTGIEVKRLFYNSM